MPETVAVPEQALVGSVLLRPSVLVDVLDLLGEDGALFVDPFWGQCWTACVHLWRHGSVVDLVTVADRLRSLNRLDGAGGYPALVAAYDSLGTASDAPSYARLIREAAQRRRLAQFTEALAGKVARDTPEDVTAWALSELTAASRPSSRAVSLASVLSDAMASWQAGPSAGLTTGFPDLDTLLGGFQPGQLIYLAAQTSRGKTAWALHLAEHAARVHGAGVLIFSLEMTNRDLAERFVAAKARMGTGVIRHQMHQDRDVCRRVVGAAGPLSNLPIFLQDSSALTVEQIAAESYRMHQAHGLGLIIVDYIGLLTPPDTRQSRNDWLGSVSQRLKALAKDCGVPVLALSQLSRDSARTGRAPELHDLRDSGNLEQDANVVLMLHRPEPVSDQSPTIRLDVLVRKNRSGPLGEVPVAFRRATGAFEPWVDA